MSFIFSILFPAITIAYVVLRNRFVPMSSQQEYMFVAGMIGGMLAAGFVFDIIRSRYIERFNISKSLFLFVVFSLLLSLLLYWGEDIIQNMRIDDTNLIKRMAENILHFGGGILGLVVAAILAPIIFKNNIVISVIVFILGMWAQYGLGYGVFISYPLSLIAFLGFGLYLRRRAKVISPLQNNGQSFYILNNMSGQKINFLFLIFVIVINIFLFSERPRGEETLGAMLAIILEFLVLVGLNLFLKIYKKEQVHFVKITTYFIASVLIVLFVMIYIPSNIGFCRKYYPDKYRAWEAEGQLNIFQRIAALGCEVFNL